MAKLNKRPIAQAGVGDLISNREAQSRGATPSTPACAQPARQTAADMSRFAAMAVEQTDERHRSKRRERSSVASSRAKNEPGRGHHEDPANALQATCERVPARWLRVLFIFSAKPQSSTQQAASVTARFYTDRLEHVSFPATARLLRLILELAE